MVSYQEFKGLLAICKRIIYHFRVSLVNLAVHCGIYINCTLRSAQKSLNLPNWVKSKYVRRRVRAFYGLNVFTRNPAKIGVKFQKQRYGKCQ